MTKPVTIPNTFATATTAIPLSQLDSDFSTVATALNDANTYSNYAADTGVANAYVVTLSGVSTTYSAGLRIQFKAGASNTGASTLNVNGGGTKNITFQDASALSSGTIAANAIVDVMYDGTQFLLMNDPAGATGGDVVGPASATDNAIVRFDGATGKLVQNSVVTIADSTGDISGVGTLNATTLDATNIEVTNIKAKDGTAAASIADSTGVISVTANPVLSGGTANGVLYLNGSKVATSGSALTFDGTNFAASNQIIAGIGVATANVLARSNVSNGGSGFSQFLFGNASTDTRGFLSYSHASEAILFGTSSAEQMRLTSTGLGIGTSSNTDSKLYVKGNLSTAYGLKLESTAGAAKSYGFYIASDALTIRDVGVGADRLTLDSSGNLGLGVTPSAWNSSWKALQIGSLSNFVNNGSGNTTDVWHNGYVDTGGFVRYLTTAAASFYRLEGNTFKWFNAPSGTAGNAITFTQAMTLDASGQLGIGTTSPGQPLVVAKNQNGSTWAQVSNTTSGTGAAAGVLLTSDAGIQGTLELDSSGHNSFPNMLRLRQIGAYPIGFFTSDTERARIDSSGYFFRSASGAFTSGQNCWQLRADEGAIQLSSATSTGTPALFYTSTGTAGTITTSGTSTAYNTSSDYRLKDNQQPLTNSGAFIDALQPKTWTWKTDGSKGVGFIAHEVQEVSPGSVVGEKDAVDEEGKPIMQAMEYGSAEFIANIIAELQSLRQRVALLEGN